MSPTDHPVLFERLTELAEALGSRALTEAGMKVWIQTLREFSIPDIVDVLTGWAKTSTKMPAPADIWKRLNDVRTDAIEKQAAIEKHRFEVEAQATLKRDPVFAKKLHALVAELKNPEPRDPKDWARRIYLRFISAQLWTNGKELNAWQVECACVALGASLSDAYAMNKAAREKAA